MLAMNSAFSFWYPFFFSRGQIGNQQYALKKQKDSVIINPTVGTHQILQHMYPVYIASILLQRVPASHLQLFPMYWKTLIKSSLSFLFSWLNKPHSISLSSYVKFSCLIMLLVALCWSLSNFSASPRDSCWHPVAFWKLIIPSVYQQRKIDVQKHLLILRFGRAYITGFVIPFVVLCKVLCPKLASVKLKGFSMPLIIQCWLQSEIPR